MKRLRKGLISDIIAEYLTPINMLLFITFLMMIAVIAWFINVWWTVEQQKLLLLKQSQQAVSVP
ncbi:hypothetical protein EYM_01440 [Ignicoccus islandicus DSM 13165]|uniref:Uncharacterized protein n=1 Tax=Ignicoccus islandicus DSM 13165 TaxID=940295 RepID=A0A0U3ECN1_9CREN|nr:hypothetical protein [Ignicoccus islandicus]ALU12211.1 hypothetical protein EYM_01440 [Ignicoccus islandicus DSM 13165]